MIKSTIAANDLHVRAFDQQCAQYLVTLPIKLFEQLHSFI